MTKTLAIAALSIVLAGAAVPGGASAQQKACPGGEGRMADGTCVNPALAASLRQRGVIMNQLKISETALPVAPRQDRVYPRAGEFNRYELGQDGNASTNPNPRSP